MTRSGAGGFSGNAVPAPMKPEHNTAPAQYTPDNQPAPHSGRTTEKGGTVMNTFCIPCVLNAAAGVAGTTTAQQDMARALVKVAAIGVAVALLWLVS
jgi:hypothetical protein